MEMQLSEQVIKALTRHRVCPTDTHIKILLKPSLFYKPTLDFLNTYNLGDKNKSLFLFTLLFMKHVSYLVTCISSMNLPPPFFFEDSVSFLLIS